MHQEICLVIWLSITSVLAVDDDQPYCMARYRRLCQGKGRHVGCIFPLYGPGPSCENYTQIIFTNSMKRYVTNDINRRRQRIASGNEKVRGGIHLPRPQVMMLVEWDRELAYLAQRLADQCHFVHDDCRATVRYPYAGQTVGEVRWRRLSESEELSAQRAIRRVLDAWWGERRRVYPKQLIAPFRHTSNSRGVVWGHFSQLAVWSLTAVGCGAVRHGKVRSRLLLVCDFSHTNMLGERTIIPGPLAPCPIHTVRRAQSGFPLLCGLVRHQKPVDGQEDYSEDFEDEEDIHDFEADINKASTQVRITEREQHLKTYRIIPRPDLERNDMEPVVERETTRRIMADTMDEDFRYRDQQSIDDQKCDDLKRPSWRENQDNFEESRNPKQYILRAPEDVNIVQNYRPTAKPPELHTDGLLSRHRWKQTRNRPRRPGANALLNIPTSIQKYRPLIKSLKLDQDDLDQLFRDTGFKFDWRKKSS